MKAKDLQKERDGGRRHGAISVRLENINKALDSIRTFISGLEAEIEATGHSSADLVSQAPGRKPYPDRDD
jgi:hypothetical protein